VANPAGIIATSIGEAGAREYAKRRMRKYFDGLEKTGSLLIPGPSDLTMSNSARHSRRFPITEWWSHRVSFSLSRLLRDAVLASSGEQASAIDSAPRLACSRSGHNWRGCRLGDRRAQVIPSAVERYAGNGKAVPVI